MNVNSHAADALLAADAAPKRLSTGMVFLTLLGVMALVGVAMFGYLWGIQLAFAIVFQPISTFQTISLILLVTGLSLPPALIWKALR